MSSDLAIRHATVPEKIAYAKAMAESNLLPSHYRRQPANLLIALEYAEAFGIAPINAITSVFVVDGKPSASADLIAAMVRRAGHKLRVDGDDTHATAELIRADDPDYTFRAEWTLDKARQAGLLGKGTWKSYPGALLRARAITEVARMGASDALFGVIYTPEEVGAEVGEDGTPVLETVTVHEASGRDWPAEAEQIAALTDLPDDRTHNDLLRDLWAECAAWGELTDEIKQKITALVEASKVTEQAPDSEPVDAVVVSEDQAALDDGDPWTRPAA